MVFGVVESTPTGVTSRRARETPRHLRQVVRWLLFLAAIPLFAIAVFDLLRVANHDCPLPALDFEVTRSELVSRESLPPRVTCRYFYEDHEGVDRFPPSTRVISTGRAARFGIAAGLALVTALAIGKKEGSDAEAQAPKPQTATFDHWPR